MHEKGASIMVAVVLCIGQDGVGLVRTDVSPNDHVLSGFRPAVDDWHGANEGINIA